MNVVFRCLSENLLYCIVFVSAVFAIYAGLSLVFKKIIRVVRFRHQRKNRMNRGKDA